MKINKDAKGFLNKESYIGYYTRDKGALYSVAFVILIVVYAIAFILSRILLFITSPLWIIPYLIYLKVKGGSKDE